MVISLQPDAGVLDDACVRGRIPGGDTAQDGLASLETAGLRCRNGVSAQRNWLK
jgi:hypothetical protein